MATPVSNTITSTTSATQDLEVFKNYPTEKNNKLIQQKYGSEDEFFKKVAAEGYAEGFKGKELNLPATQMLDEAAMKQFLDPSGLSAYKGTELEKYAGTQDLTRNIPTMQSTFPGGQEIPISEIEKWKTMDKSGVTDLGQLWNQAGGEYPAVDQTMNLDRSGGGIQTGQDNKGFALPGGGQIWNEKLGVPDLLAAGKASQALYNQGALPDVKMTTDTPVDMPSNVPKGDVRKIIESIEQKILTEDDSWSILKMLKNIRKLKEKFFGEEGLVTAGPMLVAEGTGNIANMLKDEVLQLEQKYQTSLKENVIPTINEWAQGIQKWGGEMKEKVSSADIFGLDISGDEADYKERVGKQNERLEAVGLDPVKIPLNLDISYKKFKWKDDKVGGEKIPLQEPAHKKAAELLKREKLMMEAGKAGADPQAELEKYIANKRELDIVKEKEAKEGWYGEDKIFGIDLEKLLKKDKKAVEKKETKDVIQQVTEEKIAPQADERRDLEEDAINQLMKDAETKEGLGDGERGDLIENLKDKGVKTKGLTDKNMLLIAMGLGMMASDKPGLQGVGAGALEGLKLVAPLMKEKSSDIQMITVKDKDGNNVIVRYNKKKGTYEHTGLQSGTTSLGEWDNKIKALAKRSTLYNEEDITNIMIHSMLYSKDKPKAEAIRLTMGLLSSRIPELTKDAEALRELAEDIVKGNTALDVSASDIGLKT